MAEIKLSARGQKNFQLELGERTSHSHLKHLGFEESGHRGFQKKLTEEQLELIEKVKNKEDVSNRVTAISDKNTHEQYPSAKAVYHAMNECGDFEIVKADTLTEKASTIQLNFPNQYKELYIRFVIPPSEEAATGSASTEKARFRVQTLNDSGSNLNKEIYNMGNQFITDYTDEWYTTIHIQVIGTYCRTELWHDKAEYGKGGYAKMQKAETYSGTVAPSVPMVRDYIDRLKFIFMTNGGITDGSVRYLPAGTTYEIWGIRK